LWTSAPPQKEEKNPLIKYVWLQHITLYYCYMYYKFNKTFISAG